MPFTTDFFLGTMFGVVGCWAMGINLNPSTSSSFWKKNRFTSTVQSEVRYPVMRDKVESRNGECTIVDCQHMTWIRRGGCELGLVGVRWKVVVFQIRKSWMSTWFFPNPFMISSRSYGNYIQRCIHRIRTLNLQSFHGFKPLCLCCASDILLAILPIASSPMLSQLSSTRIGLDSICMAAMNQVGTPFRSGNILIGY